MKTYIDNRNYVSDTDLDQFFLKNDVSQGDKFKIFWKIERKVRTYTLFTYSHWNCELCGPITEITVQKGNVRVDMDNHFGPLHGFEMGDFEKTV